MIDIGFFFIVLLEFIFGAPVTPLLERTMQIVFDAKSADAKPNFEKWAMGSKAFKYQSVTEARSFIRKERQRLEQKWINLDRNGDLLTIRTTNPVDVIADMERDENDPEGYKLVILLDKTRKTFFPYTHMGDPYAVIPKNIESVLAST